MNLTVVTPTIGRETLRDLVDSAAGTKWLEQDQWFVIGDTVRELPEWVEPYVQSLGHPFLWATEADATSCAGNAQRNKAIELAHHGNYLVWLDDNDTLTKGALNIVRSSLPPVPGPVQFRVTWSGVHRGLSDLKKFPMTYPNPDRVSMEEAGGGQQFVTPNLPGLTPRWLHIGSSDYDFIRDTLLLYGGPHALKQVDYLIAHTT